MITRLFTRQLASQRTVTHVCQAACSITGGAGTWLPASGTIKASTQFGHSRTRPTESNGKEFSSPQLGQLKSRKFSSVISVIMRWLFSER